MKKSTLVSLVGLGTIGAFAIVSLAFADPTPLAVTCSGNASGTAITWTADATGGSTSTAYSYLWSGDSIDGATSTSVTGTYSANGTYTASIQATDASSSVATSSCAATVTGVVTPATTSTLNVVVAVDNTAGGSAIPSGFTVNVNGANATPSSFAGSNTGSTVVVTGGDTYSVGISSVSDYVETSTGNCGGSIAAGNTDTCAITETYVAPSSTPTPTPTPTPTYLPRVNPPTLSIGPAGQFFTHGMTVTSVASGSFQGEVWGITYTINWSGNFAQPEPFEFWFRYGPSATTTPATQLAVGDEVGVSGKVSSSSPLVVDANVVRDYSIASPRALPSVGNFFGNGNEGNNGNGNNNANANSNEGESSSNTGSSVNASASAAIQTRIGDLFKELENIKGLFQNFHFGGNGNGKSGR